MLDDHEFQIISGAIQRSARMPDTPIALANELLGRAHELRTAPPQPTGKRVILVPGILGNELTDGGFFPLWLNPVRLLFPDGLERLKVRPGITYQDDGNSMTALPIKASSLLPVAYEPISVWLGAHGFVVKPFPFDWRMSIDRAADELHEVLTSPGALPTQLVCHSMGCLVARRCAQKYPELIRDEKIERAVFIAPPFRGSFVPVQVAAEHYWASNLLAIVGLGPRRMRQTFCTFPGFAEMIADPSVFTDSSAALDSTTWPLTNFGDRLISRGRKFAQDLGQPDTQEARDADTELMKRSIIVLCTTRDTVTSATLSGQNVSFQPRAHGDDTVPTLSAWDDRSRVYEAFWTHSLIPAEPAVFAGITEWLMGDLASEPRSLSRFESMPVQRPASLFSSFTGFPALLSAPLPFTATEMDHLGLVLGISDLESRASPEEATLAPSLRSAFNEEFRRIEAARLELPTLLDQRAVTSLGAQLALIPSTHFDPIGGDAGMIMARRVTEASARSMRSPISAELERKLMKARDGEVGAVVHLQPPSVDGTSPRPAEGSHHRAVAACMEILAPFDQGRDGVGWWFKKGLDLDCGADIRVRPALSGWKTATLNEAPSGESTTTVPDWCAEILLPGSAAMIWQQKLPLYVRRGVGWIWLIDPELGQITAFRVHAGRATWMGSVISAEASALGPFEIT